jgi:signal transduction histidine kinase
VALTEEERAWVQQHPEVYWGADPEWPPFSSLDDQGNLSGIDVDIVHLIASRTGLQTKLVKTRNWSETLRKAAAGEIDFVGGIARTEERERLLGLHFTEVFCEFPTAIVTRKDMPFLTSIREFKSKRITLPRDYATTEELQRRYPDVQLQLTQNEEQSMLAVAGNGADATALNLASASYIVHMRGLSNLKISGFTEVDFFLSLAVKRDSTVLRSILAKGLASIGSREKEEIYARYITPETRRALDWKTWRRWVIYSVTAGATALLGALLWNRVLSREIARRKTAEASLRQATVRLGERAKQLEAHARELETLNGKLKLAYQDLESFSYSVSHDLKAPLRRLRSFADLLVISGGEQLDSDAQKSIEAIQTETHRMAELIESLLALARVDRAELHPVRVNLNELTTEAIHDLELETKGRDLNWETAPLPEVECDRNLIKAVLLNLLGNAAKFTRGRKPAVVKIGLAPEKSGDHEMVFFVQDNGAGFDQNQANSLFETFRRLHRYDEFEGSGIGLATVKRIIQKHGGRVWAEGAVNQGATFYFSLIGDPAGS